MHSAMKTTLVIAAVATAAPLSMMSLSNIDPEMQFAWGENTGWTVWQHDTPNPGDGVHVTMTHLGGFVWAENIGWINLGEGDGPYGNDPQDGLTFGVNVDPANGEMYGKAWGENVGWINFDTRATQGPEDQQAIVDFCANELRGYVWGENIGWINLEDAEHFIALGPDCAKGDVACDGVIGLNDFAWFAGAVTGPGATADCLLFDADDDLDVDLVDFGAFQVAYTGD